MIVAVVAPVLHVYVAPPVAVSEVLAPRQTVKLPLIVAVGLGLSVTVTLSTAVHPTALGTVTENVVVVVG